MNRFEKARQQIQRVIGGRYRLLDVLGVGGTGAVYLAQHVVTEEQFALKLIEKSIAMADPTAVERFLRESRAASRIGHPGVVKVFDAQADEATEDLYMVMELLKGQDLADAMQRGELTLRAFVTVVTELLDILAAVHDRGFVHRDIKPSNVFLMTDESGITHVKLLDFGIARQSDQNKAMTSLGTVLGTPWYMAPEQARGQAVDARADLWSVGALMFHALMGVPPFDGENSNVVISHILTATPPSLRKARTDLPSSLCDVVDRALQRDVRSRWSGAVEMSVALRSALSSLRDVSLLSARGVALLSTQTRWAHDVGAASHPKRSWRAGIAAATLALCASMAALIAWKRTGTESVRPTPTAAMTAPLTSPPPMTVPAPVFVEAPPRVDRDVPSAAPSAAVADLVANPEVTAPVNARASVPRTRVVVSGRSGVRRTPAPHVAEPQPARRNPLTPMEWEDP